MLQELLVSDIYFLHLELPPADTVVLGRRHERLCGMRASRKLKPSTDYCAQFLKTLCTLVL